MLKIGYYFLSTILFWTALCVLVERFIKGKSKTDHDIKNRLVSIIRGIFGFVYPVMYFLSKDFDTCSASNDTDRFIITMSISYFIYDFAACLYYDIYDTSLVIHHVSAILGYFIAYESEFGAKIAIYGLMIAESSNFAMHVRAILKLKNLKNTQIYNILDIKYLVQYVLFRGLLCPFNLYYAFACGNVSPVIQLSCFVISAQSYMFIFRMFKIIKRKWIEHKEREAKNIHLFWFSENPLLKSLDYMKNDSEAKVF